VATDLSLPSKRYAPADGAQWKSLLDAGQAPDFHKKPTVFLLLAA
jgi:16S rRNA (cytidine1402-2'-O)-methyltransferase